MRRGEAGGEAQGGEVPPVGIVEIVPIVFLLGLTVALTVQAGPAMRFMDEASKSLHLPRDYVRSVLTSEGAR